jgi:hypothetical protein
MGRATAWTGPPEFHNRQFANRPASSNELAAGTLTLGCWDHRVPGANNTLTALRNERLPRTKSR